MDKKEEIVVKNKTMKNKKENLETKSLKARLNIINNDIDNSVKSRLNGLISMADAMEANGLKNNAHTIYLEVINIMENTLLKDYLLEEYMNIKEHQY